MDAGAFANVISRFSGVQQRRGYWMARCPAHNDKRQSLSIRIGNTGALVVRCHVGCSFGQVRNALGLDVGEFFPKESERPKMNIKAVYSYRSAAGELLFQTVRLDPKDFRQRRPDGDGGWHWNMEGVETVPYRLPELLEADKSRFVLLSEGEKASDRLAKLGFVATNAPLGAGKWHDEYAAFFTGRKVAILADDDPPLTRTDPQTGEVITITNEAGEPFRPGLEHSRTVAAGLANYAAATAIIKLHDDQAKKDVWDWLEEGHTAEELKSIIKAAFGNGQPHEPDPAPESTPCEPANPPEERFEIDYSLSQKLAEDLLAHSWSLGPREWYFYALGLLTANAVELTAEPAKAEEGNPY
jgi:hypothetical protein